MKAVSEIPWKTFLYAGNAWQKEKITPVGEIDNSISSRFLKLKGIYPIFLELLYGIQCQDDEVIFDLEDIETLQNILKERHHKAFKELPSETVNERAKRRKKRSKLLEDITIHKTRKRVNEEVK